LFDRGFAVLAIDARGMADEALSEVVARCVDAGLAVLVNGASDAVRARTAKQLGERSVEGPSGATIAQLADTMAAVCALA
jgi:hypothetical protein